MATTDYARNTSSLRGTQDYDLWIISGYVVLSSILLAALYLASGGPGNDGDALAVMLVMP